VVEVSVVALELARLSGKTYMTAAIEPKDAAKGRRRNGSIEAINCPPSRVELGLDTIDERPFLGGRRVGMLHGLHDGGLLGRPEVGCFVSGGFGSGE
jgi:hypothetical protein